MSVVFHPLPTSCTPAAAHLPQRWHAKYPLPSPSPSTTQRLISKKGGSFAAPQGGCRSPDAGGSVLACRPRRPATGGTLSSLVPGEVATWTPKVAVFPLWRRLSTTQVAAARQPSNSKKEDKLVTEGLITELLPNCMFRVRLDNGDVILGYVSGKMRTKMVRVLVGDRVKVEVSRYDSTRGRIVYRLRSKSSTD